MFLIGINGHCSVITIGFVSMFVDSLWDVLDGDDDERLVSASTGPLDPTDRVAHKVCDVVIVLYSTCTVL